MKVNPYLITGPVLFPLTDVLYRKYKKRKNAQTVDALDNLQRLHRLREAGVITEEEFRQYKHKLAERI